MSDPYQKDRSELTPLLEKKNKEEHINSNTETVDTLKYRHSNPKWILGIKVKKETSCLNLFAIFFVTFLIAAKYGFLQIQITFLLESKDHFAISSDQVGRKNSYIIVWQSILTLIFLPFIGYVYELAGRRCVIMTCLFSSVALFGVIPYTAPNYPLLVFVKSLTFLLGSIVDAHPLIPDYIKSESRGKAVAIALLGSIMGEVFAMTVFIGLSINMDLN